MTPHVSRILCIASISAPMSTDFMPAFTEIKKPMVLPHAESFQKMNSCKGTSALLEIDLTIARPTESVAYL